MAIRERQPIEDAVALRLCEGVHARNRDGWCTPNGLWCWACATFSGAPTKRCYRSAPGNRRCAQVNRLADRGAVHG